MFFSMVAAVWARRCCFRCQDQEEIEIIVALGIGIQLDIKGESERFVVFTRINFSRRDVEHFSLR